MVFLFEAKRLKEDLILFERGNIRLTLATADLLEAEFGLKWTERSAGEFPSTFFLSLNVASMDELHTVLAQTEPHGGKILKTVQETPWGGFVAFIADPDGHPWEVVWNPKYQIPKASPNW